jgi:hypothetical protein
MAESDWQAVVRDLTAERDVLAAEVARRRAGEVRIEYGVRLPDGTEGPDPYGFGYDLEHCRVSAEHLRGVLIQRELRTGPWAEVGS